MDLVALYECLCDKTRLRILNLLCRGPLCVCHLQTILKEPQVKISKHLAYLKDHGMVTVTKEANWRIYGLVAKPNRTMEANLACLQDCAQEDKSFRRDLERLAELQEALREEELTCCASGARPKAKTLKSHSRS